VAKRPKYIENVGDSLRECWHWLSVFVHCLLTSLVYLLIHHFHYVNCIYSMCMTEIQYIFSCH